MPGAPPSAQLSSRNTSQPTYLCTTPISRYQTSIPVYPPARFITVRGTKGSHISATHSGATKPMRLPHFRHLLSALGLLTCILLLSTPASAQNKEQDPTTQDLPESPFSPTTPSYGGNGTGSFCVAGYSDCSTIGHREACCSLTQVCTLDSVGRVGCCEFGVKCAGEIPLKASGAGPRWKSLGWGDVGIRIVVWAVIAELAAPGGAFGSMITI